MRVIELRAFVVALSWLACAAVLATDRFCIDVHATSTDGRLQFSSTHPNNKLPRPEPFVCTGFTFRLVDRTTGAVVWERPQGDGEGPPVGAYVHDSGVVVSYDGSFNALDAKTGRNIFRWNVFEQFTAEDESHVVRSDTTAGPWVRWASNSRRSFVAHDGRLYFVVRPWWGRRFWADLTDHKLVKDPAAELTAVAAAADAQFVMSTLDGAVVRLASIDRQLEPREYERTLRRVQSAAHWAGWDGIEPAIPLLRELETCTYQGWSGGRLLPCDLDNVMLVNRGEFTVRLNAHNAIRELGGKPTVFPVMELADWRDGAAEPFLFAGLDRQAGAQGVRAGQSPVELLKLVGSPDYIPDPYVKTGPPGVWDYDIDSTEPYTLRVHWSRSCTIDRVEIIRPAIWQSGELRYRYLCAR